VTLYIDHNLLTGIISIPLQEGWLETDIPVEVVPNLTADRIGRGDVALISLAEAASLVDTHFIDPSLAIVSGTEPEAAISPIVMRTPVRPDGVEESPIRMIDTTPNAELLIRALLRGFFGIMADDFVYDAADEKAAAAQVVVLDGPLGLTEPELGYQEDLVRAWYVRTGSPMVYAVTVVGVEAEGGRPEMELLRAALANGIERRRDVRRILATEDESVDRTRLATITNALRYELDDAAIQSAGNLLARGTWGTDWKRQLPAVK
jgi:predicted solute-binding protein